ncbi:MAG TPA: hypothetical protein VF461_09875 [Gemmatimonadaceae bacterium]
MRNAIVVLCAVGAAALVGCGGKSVHAAHSLEPSPSARLGPNDGAQGGSGPMYARDSTFARDSARLRAATAAFRSLEAAVAAGYPADAPGCLANAAMGGGMGYHHTNEKLLDDSIEVERPEILVYGRGKNGEYVLNGVEYMVPFSAHPRELPAPTVMGQKLKAFDRGKFWYRHVWIWLENPKGLFEDWNPKVTCP